MQVTLTTPALLFPAISLLLLAYTNRFLALAALIRGLRSKYETEHDPGLLKQIEILRKRIILIKNMQAFGIASILTCVITMFAVYMQLNLFSGILFGISLIFMIASLLLSFQETLISVQALNLELEKLKR
jgi:hypothetical protein